MQMQHKIVFSGPVGAGKTTAISAISDLPPVSTEQEATDDTRLMKETTTVAMDYGSISLPGKSLIHLYGTPGQGRFDFMWKLLSDGAIGLVLILDHQATDPLKDMTTYLDAFSETFNQSNTVIGINKLSRDKGEGLNEYYKELKKRDYILPLMEVDAREKNDVAMLVEGLLFNIDPYLKGV